MMFIEIKSLFLILIETQTHGEHNTFIWKGHVMSTGWQSDWLCDLFCWLHIAKQTHVRAFKS